MYARPLSNSVVSKTYLIQPLLRYYSKIWIACQSANVRCPGEKVGDNPMERLALQINHCTGTFCDFPSYVHALGKRSLDRCAG